MQTFIINTKIYNNHFIIASWAYVQQHHLQERTVVQHLIGEVVDEVEARWWEGGRHLVGGY
jgi:hypothetical protein